MDLSQIAQTLASMLPYLLQGGIELAKSAAAQLGKQLSTDAWDGLKGLAEKIRARAEAKPALQEALTDAQAAPDDEDARAALRYQLKKLLQEDAELRQQLEQLLQPDADPWAKGATGIIATDRSIVIGPNASGNVANTGIITGLPRRQE
ncbi:MAG: hypothetical protein NZ552_01270 [Planctomycetes bacterium]|nr:hypothetical protein [Planctomycetota bacterium]